MSSLEAFEEAHNMDETGSAMQDLFLNNEAQNIILGFPWKVESELSEKEKNILSNDDDDRDIQNLFDGVIPEVNNNDDDTSSESEDESPCPREANCKGISDEEIKNLRVKDLNKILRNIPCEEAAKIRKRRRNLKNRGYAYSCRLRKQREHEDLMNENILLKKRLEDGKFKLLKVWNEKEVYKKKYTQTKQAFAAYKHRLESSFVKPGR